MSLRKFYSVAEVQEFAREQKRTIVIRDGDVLDVTTFAKHHPGGEGMLSTMNGRDITEQFKGHKPLSYQLADTTAIGSLRREIKRELDYDQPLMPQIWRMDHQQYLRIINLPHWLFVESPRMFQTNFMEAFSHSQWYHVLSIHLAFYLYVLVTAFDFQKVARPMLVVPLLLAGIFFFSLIEYLMHRFLFHSQKYLPDNFLGRPLRYLHFILHGIHHTIPFDPQTFTQFRDRLVFPPVLALVVGCIGYVLLYTPLTYFYQREYVLLLMAGIGLGYLIYDMTHYSLHHVKSTAGSYFKRLQRYHNWHHFSGENAGYGVSSGLWDVIFGTKLTMDHSKEP